MMEGIRIFFNDGNENGFFTNRSASEIKAELQKLLGKKSLKFNENLLDVKLLNCEECEIFPLDDVKEIQASYDGNFFIHF